MGIVERASDPMDKEASSKIEGDTGAPSGRVLLLACLAGGVASMAAAFLYVLFAKFHATCVVYTSLLFSPCVCIVVGMSLLGSAAEQGADFNILLGVVLIALGAFSACCNLCCWRHLIPFMIKMTEVVSQIFAAHLGVMIVSLVATLASLGWTLALFVAAYGLNLENADVVAKYDKAVAAKTELGPEDQAKIDHYYGVWLGIIFSFILGGQVLYNICHVTYCGVFGRWYHGRGERGFVVPSVIVSLTTSFGSICAGSFIVASIRTLDFIIRQAMRAAEEEGNFVSCILLCLLECLVNCIGDIIEYFSEWAYVQCAVRGSSFCEAARITYSMLTCANVNYIVEDLLLNSLVVMGSLFCAAVGAVSGASAGAALCATGKVGVAASAGAGLGFVTGLLAGGNSLGVYSSGVKTILACWADNPDSLMNSHPEIHKEFVSRIQGKLFDGSESSSSAG